MLEDHKKQENSTPPKRRRVAFFGGSFDPPHQGHLAVATAARQALDLDEVLFAPVGRQPLKPSVETPFDDRLAMTKLAIADYPGFEISLVDRPQPGQAPNYTIDSLETLRRKMPVTTDLYCLMGADSLLSLHLWHRAAEIPFVATVIVASRPGESLDELARLLPEGLSLEPPLSEFDPEKNLLGAHSGCLHTYMLRGTSGKRTPLHLLAGVHVDIRATDLRASVVHNASAECLVPAAVQEYIRRHELYR